MQAVTTAGGGYTMTILPNGETRMSSTDPWYIFLRALADLFLAGEIGIEDLSDQEVRWATTYREGEGHRKREFACPAARDLAGAIALTWMEPECLHKGNTTEDIACDCEPMDRRERLRELIG